MTATQLEAEMKTILDRLKLLSGIEGSEEVMVSFCQLCGEYGGLQRELENANTIEGVA